MILNNPLNRCTVAGRGHGAMKTSTLLVVLGLGTAWTAPAAAYENSSLFDKRAVAAAGGSYAAMNGGAFLAARVRYIPNVPFALEANLYAPYGLGLGLLLDVYRGEELRVHAFDLGVFGNLPWAKVNHPKIDRLFDLTIGCGIEWKISGRHIISVDWRAFLADPTSVPLYYGNYALSIYKDALIGGQLWLGYVFDLN